MQKLDVSKLSAVRKLLKTNKLDGIVISDYVDMKYLLGDIFLPGEAVLLVYSKGLYVSARSLYEAPVKANYPEIKIEACDSQRELKIIEVAKKLGLKSIAFDSIKERYFCGKAFADAGFTQLPAAIDGLRVAKTESELAIMKKAAKIAYSGFNHIQKFLKPGMTEMAVASELENYMKSKGASALSFDTIVAFGDGGSNPHYSTGNAKLKKNMAILIDFGCVYKGYCSDITRTFWFGDKPVSEFTKILAVAKGAHAEVIKKAKLGMTGAEIDNIARGYICAAGYGDYFTHGTGHGIGMQVHEEAYINQNNPNGKILENYCFSVEPGIYLTGKFGVRYEDCFYMTKQGIKKIS